VRDPKIGVGGLRDIPGMRAVTEVLLVVALCVPTGVEVDSRFPRLSYVLVVNTLAGSSTVSTSPKPS